MLTRLKPTEIYTLHEELIDIRPTDTGNLVRDNMGESGFTPSGGAWAYEVWGDLRKMGPHRIYRRLCVEKNAWPSRSIEVR